MRTAGLVALTVCAGVLALATAPAAGAATFHVNSTADLLDKNAGDGVCKAANGKCTLRAAVMEANADATPDTIKLPKGTFDLTRPGSGAAAQGDLDVTQPVTIKGAGPGATVVRQTVSDRLLQVNDGVALTLSGMKLTGGHGHAEGGAIYVIGPLILNHVTVSGNEVTGATVAGATGGAIRADSGLDVLHSKITNNTAKASMETADGGGIEYTGSGSDSMLVIHSLIAGNVAKITGAGSDSVGGGISNSGMNATILDSTISGNQAGRGGAVFSNGSNTLAINSSTLSGNSASEAGGAVDAAGPVGIDNSTLSGNQATGAGSGGAIARFTGTTDVNFTTIAGNKSSSGARAIDAGTNAGSVTLFASILSDSPTESGTDCFNTAHISSSGYNLDPGTSCALSNTGDLSNAHAKLGPLAHNGGPTKTRALKSGSDAIDHVASGCPPPTTDQRGVSRPQGPECDSGSYEKQ